MILRLHSLEINLASSAKLLISSQLAQMSGCARRLFFARNKRIMKEL